MRTTSLGKKIGLAAFVIFEILLVVLFIIILLLLISIFLASPYNEINLDLIKHLVNLIALQAGVLFTVWGAKASSNFANNIKNRLGENIEKDT